VYHPPGKPAYATVGFAGFIGALTGMSSAGITVHEAGAFLVFAALRVLRLTARPYIVFPGDDNKEETFNGFPWCDLRNVVRVPHQITHVQDVAAAIHHGEREQPRVRAEAVAAGALFASFFAACAILSFLAVISMLLQTNNTLGMNHGIGCACLAMRAFLPSPVDVVPALRCFSLSSSTSLFLLSLGRSGADNQFMVNAPVWPRSCFHISRSLAGCCCSGP
jgi:hypothetical protein